ncbi:nitroimidazol reductase NimA-like FMN-containing flavoprotein (pyridoxamine 5'-phosphate oxidase superfamily) [Nocardioides luteus]|uniref:Pyridoxamine 5'-phosphate oxidase n=1 Tax=Nocardioides luteus TaxID=1844 RepID=A0ABQ5T267_9ACTN|nr:pyridoxamine 5'-phosphate oxidase family protein [Nocardioides luteus]MDR7311517.1 nitroimidazol reductase NimA-like FMN-containing flavoprotein (pyridoxamine 5'-phosphate oxidase superfamily) [Nocardioides luteus]GGR55071.1 pyridoxamine 5'-phosphate oxidase [Nocardioides luteus]GLJ70166.1 pyridoxamine 5'-phosphate oxidase [Nocardioides luteus]
MSQLEELTVEESWRLAAGAQVSRIGWTGPRGPVVIPVNHVVHDDSVWIRTSAHSSMAEQIDESAVALLVDELDPDTHVGWSVQFKGRAEILYRDSQVPDTIKSLHSWPAGARPLWVRLHPKEVTGRRLVG